MPLEWTDLHQNDLCWTATAGPVTLKVWQPNPRAWKLSSSLGDRWLDARTSEAARREAEGLLRGWAGEVLTALGPHPLATVANWADSPLWSEFLEGLEGEKKMPKHSMQPLIRDEQGVIRFQQNPIVRFLLDAGPFDMNQLAAMPFADEDRAHFAQLIGYSVSGYGELSYVSDAAYEAAAEGAGRLAEER